MIESFVFGELSSKSDFMRARSLLIYNAYSLESFSDEHVFEAGKLLLENMTHNNAFPVQAIAATALGNFVGYNATIDLFKVPLADLLKTILDVLDQFFTNDLIETLKELVREYDEYITDLAVHLCDKLAENYVNLMG